MRLKYNLIQEIIVIEKQLFSQQKDFHVYSIKLNVLAGKYS